VCDTAVETTAGGLTTGWWAAMWECFSSHPLPFRVTPSTVVAPPSSIVKCLWGVFVLGICGFVLVVCVCVSVSGVLFSVGVCV